MPEPTTVLEGAILVGGQSRRMGRDKSAIRLRGTTMLQRVATAMAPITTRVRLVGLCAEPSEGFETQIDLRPGLGPLSGIHAALATAGTTAVVVVACDLPFVTTRLLAGLVEQLGAGVDAVVPRIAGRAIPVCGVYRTSCATAVSESLDRHELEAHRLLASLATRYVDGDTLSRLDPDGLALSNINTPGDLERAEVIATTNLK